MDLRDLQTEAREGGERTDESYLHDSSLRFQERAAGKGKKDNGFERQDPVDPSPQASPSRHSSTLFSFFLEVSEWKKTEGD